MENTQKLYSEWQAARAAVTNIIDIGANFPEWQKLTDARNAAFEAYRKASEEYRKSIKIAKKAN